MEKERQIIFHKYHFRDFYVEQPLKVKEKIGYVLKMIILNRKINIT